MRFWKLQDNFWIRFGNFNQSVSPARFLIKHTLTPDMPLIHTSLHAQNGTSAKFLLKVSYIVKFFLKFLHTQGRSFLLLNLYFFCKNPSFYEVNKVKMLVLYTYSILSMYLSMNQCSGVLGVKYTTW